VALRGDRAAAVSYTFDDALRDHAELAAPLLEMFGFRGTSFHRTYSPRYSPVGRTQPTPGNAALPRVSACGLISV
jgi:hypothetical protein